MIKLKCLSNLIKEHGLTEDDLNQPIKPEHCDTIAIQVGQDWDNLATAIGFEKNEVDDIKEEYHHQEPKNRRISLLRKWKKKYGSDATYVKMIHGLEEIKNRELTETVIKFCTECKLYNQKQSFETHMDIAVTTKGREQQDNNADCVSKVALSLVIIMMYLLFTCGFITDIQRDLQLSVTRHLHSDSTMALWSPNKFQKGTNCSQQVGHDLPLLHGLFVGRENDVRKVIEKVKKANILNINGAPGFGKSTLAIHVGYRLVKNCTSVRYINMEELSWKTLSEIMDSNVKRNFTTERKNKCNQKKQRGVTVFSGSQVAEVDTVSIDSEYSNNYESSFFNNLLHWSKLLNRITFLILDNADLALTSSLRGKFINMVTLLVQHSNFHLHVIVVSQEKLLLLENFNRWTVRQLHQHASAELLGKLAPYIASNEVTEIAELLQGCPLALKVIGNILNIYGQKIIHELEYELQQQPITVLDKVSDQQQRFSIIMDLVLSKLKFLKKCGYAVSLFPGSFSREAGIEILVPKECLELFEKYSLLDDYFFGNQHRYIMHRLIREYLKEKANSNDIIIFQKRFCIYYSRFVLTHTIESELDDINQHELMSESKNLDSLEEILLANSKTNVLDIPQELAALVILISKGYLQVEKLRSRFRLCLKELNNTKSEFINPVTYGELISYIVKHLYKSCKCETLREYIQKILDHPSKQVFDCELTTQLFSMRSYLNLSQQEQQFVHNIWTYHCPHNLLYFLYTYISNYFLGIVIIIIILISLIILFRRQTSLHSLYYKASLYVTTAIIFVLLLLLIPYETIDVVLITEVTIKLLCYASYYLADPIFILLMYYYKFHPSFITNYLHCYNQQCTMCFLAVSFVNTLVMLLIHTFYLDLCSGFPICH